MELIDTLDAERVQEDLERRFASFVGAHRDRARRLAYRLVGGDAAAADDVTQDALVRAWSALPRFRGDASLDTWFYRILVRQAHSHRRWRGVRQLWHAGTDPEWVGATGPVGDPALRGRIVAALEGLTRPQREVFVLVHLEGFTVGEAAAILGKAEGTAKSHLHRALRKLRVELRELWDATDAEDGG